MRALGEVVHSRMYPLWYHPCSDPCRFGHSTTAILTAFVNMQDARCQTPLHLACIYGNAECVTLLLQLGASPWYGDELGRSTCARLCCLHGGLFSHDAKLYLLAGMR